MDAQSTPQIWGPPHLVPCPLVPAELRDALEEVLPDLQRDGIKVFYLSSKSPTPGVEALLPAIEAASDEPLPGHYRAGITANSKAIYIYTSGTTGEASGGLLPGERRLGGLGCYGRGAGGVGKMVWVTLGMLVGSHGVFSAILSEPTWAWFPVRVGCPQGWRATMSPLG